MKKNFLIFAFGIFTFSAVSAQTKSSEKQNNLHGYLELPQGPSNKKSYDPATKISAEVIYSSYTGMIFLTMSHYMGLSPEDQGKVRSNPNRYYVHTNDISSEMAARNRKSGTPSLVQ